jgi:hypothetical protein
MEVGVEDEAAFADELDAVNRGFVFADKIEHLYQRRRVDADFFWRGNFPTR